MIWDACNGSDHILPITGELFRLVESQEQVATMGYVDTLEEQALLEELLEASKPSFASDEQDDIHYLLRTPFRYPPLEYGSRYGAKHEPSLFYGGVSVASTLIESAYYRFVFLLSMDTAPFKRRLMTEHTLFKVRYASEKGILLHKKPFANYQTQLCDQKSYVVTQQLGADMRNAGVEAFQYQSARSLEALACVALFVPNVFIEDRPSMMEPWLCDMSPSEVTFKAISSRETYTFPLQMFECDGVFPMPA